MFCYLKIINTVLKNDMRLIVSCPKLKNGIEILVGQAVFKLWIKTFKMLFGSITQEPLGLPNFHAIFEFLGQLTAGCIHNPKIKLLIILRFEISIHIPPLALSKIQRCTRV